MASTGVFSQPGRGPLNRNSVTHTFSKAAAEVGLKRIRLHDLRPTYATLQRKAGQPIEVISKVRGHPSELVTLKIDDRFEGEFRAPADAIDLMLERASQNQNDITQLVVLPARVEL